MTDKKKTTDAGAIELTEEELEKTQGGVIEGTFKFFRPNPETGTTRDPTLKSEDR